jgi:DNA replication protein DnaC
MSGAEPSVSNTATHTADTPQLLLEHHLKELRLPTILREYDKVARQCAVEQVDYQHYLLRITELELLDRERRATERRIRQAKFPVVKTMNSFDFLAIPSLNKTLVLELARCEFLARRENVLLLGNSGTGKTHIALALGLAACQRGHRVRFTTTAALVSELIEARDEKKLLRFQKQIASYELLIVDELGFVPLSKTGAELLFEMLSQRYERGSTMVTSNLPFQEWTEVLGSERLTGALLDRLTHHVHILEMNADTTASSRAAANGPHPPNAEPYTPKRASGQKGLFRYAPEALLPRISTTNQQLSTGLLLLRHGGLVLLRP